MSHFFLRIKGSYCRRTLATLVLLFSFNAYCKFGFADDPLPINTITKWHHLLNQEKIKDKDFDARLGVNTNRVSAGDGLILYCLTDRFNPGKITKSQTIGPFTYRVEYEGEKRLFQSLESLAHGHDENYANCALIFKQVIPFSKVGKATVNVYGADKVNPLAIARIEIVDDRFHRWIPFGHSQQLRQLREADAKFDSVGYASISKNRTAVPTAQNHKPIIYQSLDKSGNTRTHLNPMAMASSLNPTPGRLKIGQTKNGFSIECLDEIVLSNPQSRFLARWWINGKPYIPKKKTRKFPEQITGKSITGKKLHLICDINPEILGGKKADKLEVQILYSRDGWKEFEAMEKLTTFSPLNSPLLLISNRLKLKTN